MRRILTLAEVERKHILNTLAICGANRSHTAKALGISVRCLRMKLREYERKGFAMTVLRARYAESKEPAEPNEQINSRSLAQRR
jgi:Bacterial regulatory protein, Fis family